jgi:SulP family sulfate permease
MITSIAARVKKNWKSGLTVALVSIPLSVSLAVASESTPTVGIITAVWAGIVASLLGGSNYNIVGPTGALSGVLASYAILHGSASLAMVAIVAGVFTLVAGLLKLERYLVFVPASTIHGFTLGVAFIIAFNQFNFAFGLSGLVKHERFILNVIESFRHIGAISWGTFLVFVAFLVALLLFARFTPKLPGAITLTPIGILLGYLSFKGSLPFALQTLGAKFPDISSTLFVAPHFYFAPSLVTAGITVALVAILETMISARIADGMTGTKHQKRKEIFGLGAANIVSGFFKSM